MEQVKAGLLFAVAGALWVLAVLSSVLRVPLFIIVNVLGGPLERLLNCVTTGGLLFAAFYALLRGLSTPVWAGLGVAFGATALVYGIQALRRALAPAGMVIISDL